MKTSMRSIILMAVAVRALAGTGYAATSGVTGWSAGKSSVVPPSVTSKPTVAAVADRTVVRRRCSDSGKCWKVSYTQTKKCSTRMVLRKSKKTNKQVKTKKVHCWWLTDSKKLVD